MVILTDYDKAIVASIERHGYVQVHRTNKLCWHRRARLLWLSERGVIKLTIPVIGSYYTFTKGDKNVP